MNSSWNIFWFIPFFEVGILLTMQTAYEVELAKIGGWCNLWVQTSGSSRLYHTHEHLNTKQGVEDLTKKQSENNIQDSS